MAALLAKCLVLYLSAVLLSLLCGGGASAMGLPPPQSTVNFSIAVQGMVWCNTCKSSGYNAAMNASPLQAVELRVQPRAAADKVGEGVTGKGGYFLIGSSQMAAFTINECKVYVPASPSGACGVPVPGNPGAKKGLPLKFERFVKRGDGLRALYSVGNFFFQPRNANKCR